LSSIEWLLDDVSYGATDALGTDQECAHLIKLPAMTGTLKQYGRNTRELRDLVELTARYMQDVLAERMVCIRAMVSNIGLLYFNNTSSTPLLMSLVRDTAAKAATAMIAASGADASASAGVLPLDPAPKSRTHSSGGASQKDKHGVGHGQGGSEQAAQHLSPAPAKGKTARKRSVSPVLNLHATATDADPGKGVEHGKGRRESKVARHLPHAPTLGAQLAPKSTAAPTVQILHASAAPVPITLAAATGAAQQARVGTQTEQAAATGAAQQARVGTHTEQAAATGAAQQARVGTHAEQAAATVAAQQSQVGGKLQPDGSVLYEFEKWVPYSHTGPVPVVQWRRSAHGAVAQADSNDRRWYKSIPPTGMFPTDMKRWGSPEGREWIRQIVAHGMNYRTLES
jgi:hypothetical protein